jgi:riboflavin synthase
MFTGIITHLGQVLDLNDGVLRLSLPDNLSLPEGGSLAVNGTCLTAIQESDGTFRADLSPETLRKTALGKLRSDQVVNLELPCQIGQTLDGHYVLGHVDTIGHVVGFEKEKNSYLYTFEVDAEWDRYLVEKGSVAMDGISLTIFNVDQGRFSVAIIPHTLEQTNLNEKQAGDSVNVEFDILGKYTEKLLISKTHAVG